MRITEGFVDYSVTNVIGNNPLIEAEVVYNLNNNNATHSFNNIISI